MNSKDKMTSAVEYLSQHFPDKDVQNHRVVNSLNEPVVITENHIFTSMKQSTFRNVIFRKSTFENAALTGSFFENIRFEDFKLLGNSFANCQFTNVSIIGNGSNAESNNFSQSSFENCNFEQLCIYRSGLLNATFHNCFFKDISFSGCILEGTQFVNCTFDNCDFRMVNLDYTIFTNNTYKNVVFPFYQLPYVIGFVDISKQNNTGVWANTEGQRVGMSEYCLLLDKLILYYKSKEAYFPMVNCYLAQNQIDLAKKTLVKGINDATSTRDFRLINNMCQLARLHGLIDDHLKKDVNLVLNTFIQSKDIPETQLNYYLNYVGKIKNLLNSGSSRSVTVNFVIKTNKYRNKANDVKFVNKLSQKLHKQLSENKNVDEYNISVESHSALAIVITVIGIAANLAGISDFLLRSVTKLRNRKRNKRLVKVDVSDRQKLIGSTIYGAKEHLLRVLAVENKRKLKDSIVEVFQSLQTDIEELYSKDIMVYQIKKEQIPDE